MRPDPRSRFLAPVVAMLLAFALVSQAAESEDARYYRESYVREHAGDFATAIEVMERASKASRASYFHQLRLGWLLYLAGEHADSISAYERAVALEPAAVEPYLGLLLPQIAKRAWSAAEQTARTALTRDPGSYLARSRLAWVLFSQGRHAEAEVEYRTVLQLHPADLEMRSGLGWSLLEQGKHQEAAKELERVLAVSPDNSSARTGLEEIRRATSR